MPLSPHPPLLGNQPSSTKQNCPDPGYGSASAPATGLQSLLHPRMGHLDACEDPQLCGELAG